MNGIPLFLHVETKKHLLAYKEVLYVCFYTVLYQSHIYTYLRNRFVL